MWKIALAIGAYFLLRKKPTPGMPIIGGERQLTK